MQSASFSLDNSDETSPLHPTGEVVLPFVRWSEQRLSDSTDSALRQYEAECFTHFNTATTNEEKGHWLHALAAAIVHLSNRGLSLNGVHQ